MDHKEAMYAMEMNEVRYSMGDMAELIAQARVAMMKATLHAGADDALMAVTHDVLQDFADVVMVALVDWEHRPITIVK